MVNRLTDDELRQVVALVQDAIDNHGCRYDGGMPSAAEYVAQRMGKSASGVQATLRKAKQRLGIAPVYNKVATPNDVQSPQQRDEILFQRIRDEAGTMKRLLIEARRDLFEARSYRDKVLSLVAQPLTPRDIPDIKLRSTKHLPEAAMLHISDIHWGEVISESALDGMNQYNSDIASFRILRCFQGFTDLCTKHWQGPPIARAYVILGGDLFSGEIHEELAKTNDSPMPAPVRELLICLIRAFSSLLESVPCEIEVISVPGNHSRLSRKPEAKNYVAANFDTLVADLLEWHFKTILGEKRISFYRPESGDALFNIFGWKQLVVHGDRIGSRGGRGFIGAAATIARGMKMIVDQYASRGLFIDTIHVAHFHTALMLEHGFSNDCMCGPNEYSTQELRVRPKPATQNFFQFHPERGITAYRKIQVGHPDEGSLYRGRKVENGKPK